MRRNVTERNAGAGLDANGNVTSWRWAGVDKRRLRQRDGDHDIVSDGFVNRKIDLKRRKANLFFGQCVIVTDDAARMVGHWPAG